MFRGVFTHVIQGQCFDVDREWRWEVYEVRAWRDDRHRHELLILRRANRLCSLRYMSETISWEHRVSCWKDHCARWSTQGLSAILFQLKSENSKLLRLTWNQYINSTSAAETFVESLLSVIKLQRHYDARVLISTQESSISPKLLDLCSLIVVHRFSSSEWLLMLSKQICIDKIRTEDIYHHIMKLRVSETLMFSSSSMMSWSDEKNSKRLNAAYLKIKVRKRLTFDDKKSVVYVKMI